MAIRKINPLGPVSGKIGNTVSRMRYGKEVVYTKPSSYNISYSDSAVSGRSKFAVTVKLAKLINSVPELAEVWKVAKLPGTNSYQKLIRHNAKLVSALGLTLKNIITPSGIGSFQNSLTWNGNKIVLKTQIAASIQNNPETFFALIYFENEKENNTLMLTSKDVVLSENNFLEGAVVLSNDKIKIVRQFKKAVILCAFIFRQIGRQSTHWTSTLSFEVDLTALPI
ncbi:MAG: hypothetical protein AB1775_11890 [Bacteroidota bacterium]